MRSPETNIDNYATPRRRQGVRICLATLALPSLFIACGLAGFRVNLTPSEPLGIWRIVPLSRPAQTGDLVFICAPQTAAMQQARKRGYLRAGLCPGGTAPLIKTVVALEGSRIVVDQAVTIDGAVLLNSNVVSSDGQRRVLERFRGGTVEPSQVFVHSPYQNSFDSRYFGPIPASGILGTAQQVLTYAP